MKHLDQSQKCPAPKHTWSGRLVPKTDLFYTFISSVILERVRGFFFFFLLICLSRPVLNNEPQLQVPGPHHHHLNRCWNAGSVWLESVLRCPPRSSGGLYPCFKGDGDIFRGPAPSWLLFMCSSRVTEWLQVVSLKPTCALIFRSYHTKPPQV